MMRQKYKVLILFNATGPTRLDQDYSEELKTKDWETEAHVIGALTKLKFPYELLGIYDDTSLIVEKVKQFKPHIIFNLVERFKNDTSYDQHIPSFLELLDIPYTGCGPIGLTLCKNKGLSKKILSYHRIHVPDFVVLHRGRRIIRPKRLAFPIFIKPLKEEASFGISQASFVENDDQFADRVQFIHEKMDQDAIAEEYIVGRELYISVIGNKRIQVLPVRELKFREIPPEEPKFASYKSKWDEEYRKRWGIKNEFADPLPSDIPEKMTRIAKKIFRLLSIDGYARLDMRLTPKGELVFIEANPNPILAEEEDLPESAFKANISYPELIRRIIKHGINAPRHL